LAGPMTGFACPPQRRLVGAAPLAFASLPSITAEGYIALSR
jgi:hypothetical protein